MTGAEFEVWLTQFNKLVQEAQTKYDNCIANEKAEDARLQDILHILENRGEELDPAIIMAEITENRRTRREAKVERLIFESFNNWRKNYADASKKLSECLGATRKYLKQEDFKNYNVRTGAFGYEAGTWVEPIEHDPKEAEGYQFTIWDFMPKESKDKDKKEKK